MAMNAIIQCTRSALLLLFSLFSFTFLFAQNTIKGIVTDTTELPMGDVKYAGSTSDGLTEILQQKYIALFRHSGLEAYKQWRERAYRNSQLVRVPAIVGVLHCAFNILLLIVLSIRLIIRWHWMRNMVVMMILMVRCGYSNNGFSSF